MPEVHAVAATLAVQWGLGPRLDDVRNRVRDGRHREGQVDAEQGIKRALVGSGPPHVLQQVALRGRAPARCTEEAQAEVDDESKACVGLGLGLRVRTTHRASKQELVCE